MGDNLTLAEFWDALNQADWFHEYSDDHSVWQRGRAELGRLTAISKQSPDHVAMMKAFENHHFSGKAWNTEKQPKPERPQP